MRPAVALVSGFGNGVVLGHQPARPRFHYPNASIFLPFCRWDGAAYTRRASRGSRVTFFSPVNDSFLLFYSHSLAKVGRTAVKIRGAVLCMFLVVSALLIHRCVSFVLLIVLLSLLYTPMFFVLSHFSFRACHYSTRP